MTSILERTVLFADLRGSTALYERLGNTRATTVVTQSVALIAQVVTRAGGQVVKTLGDGLMAVFADTTAAVQAADGMHESLDNLGVATLSGLGAAHARVSLQLQVGLACGEVVEMAGDFFGDAVNVAARLLDHAGDNETLVTAQVVDGLDGPARGRFRGLDRVQLRGRAEPVLVFLMDSRRVGEFVATAFDPVVRVPDPDGIRLTWLDMTRVYGLDRLPVILGRSPQATYCIDDSRVSRSHARIDWHGGSFQLVDLSYNGTYVRFANDAETISLRRGACTLHGSGVIGLGTPPVDPTAPSVQFEVMRLPPETDTLPHGVRVSF